MDYYDRYFGGGTLLSGAADIDFAVPRPMTSHEYYEDGTLNFHGIAGTCHHSLVGPLLTSTVLYSYSTRI